MITINKQKIKKILPLAGLITITVISVLALVYVSFKYSKKSKAAVTCVGSNPQTCTITGGSMDLVEGQYEDSNLIVDGATVILWGPHRFNNLTIKNNGVITNQPLVAVNDFNDVTSVLTSNGLRKKVDLLIAGTIRFETGGQINVDYKGYPGSEASRPYANCGQDCGSGYGPGGGGNNNSYDETTRGAGGSYGGKGGQGILYGARLAGWAKPPYGNLTANIDSAWHGSGGGAALRHKHNDRSPGAPGGGSIHIVAGHIETDRNQGNSISANGAVIPPEICSPWRQCGGAGSGGSIYIRLTNDTGVTRFDAAALGGRADTLASLVGQNGVVIIKGFNNDTGNDLKVSANGGSQIDFWGEYSGAGGAGGRITIEVKQDFTMKKWLTPIDRAGVNNFDPYSLQVNDKIMVNIQAERLSAGDEITDDIFKITNAALGSFSCQPQAPYASSISDGGIFSNERVTWVYAGGAPSHTFSYTCLLK